MYRAETRGAAHRADSVGVASVPQSAVLSHGSLTHHADVEAHRGSLGRQRDLGQRHELFQGGGEAGGGHRGREEAGGSFQGGGAAALRQPEDGEAPQARKAHYVGDPRPGYLQTTMREGPSQRHFPAAACTGGGEGAPNQAKRRPLHDSK